MELYRWIKAGEQPSQHYVNVCCRLIGEDFWFTAYYDFSNKVYVPRNFNGTGGYVEPKEIEYQEKIELPNQEELWEGILSQLHPYFLKEDYQDFKKEFQSKYLLIKK